MANKVILKGRVGKDPDVRVLSSGMKVGSLRLATTERRFNKEKNEREDHTEWHNITLWSGLAELAEKHIRKGTELYIEGKLRTDEWTDEAGLKRYTTSILADVIEFCGKKDSPDSPSGYGEDDEEF